MRKFFTDKDGAFKVVYFWMSLMLTFVTLFLTLKLTDAIRNFINGKPLGVSDALLGVLIAGVVTWAKFYNDRPKDEEVDGIIIEEHIDE
jgi:uncharacterized membrane protein (DUF485 family)